VKSTTKAGARDGSLLGCWKILFDVRCVCGGVSTEPLVPWTRPVSFAAPG
jgi:hypothetical protein